MKSMSSGRFTVANAMVPAVSPWLEIWNWGPGAYGLWIEVTSSISATSPRNFSIAERTARSLTLRSASKTIWPDTGDPLPSSNADSTSENPSVDSKPSSEKSWR